VSAILFLALRILLVFFLFGFLGLALYTIWLDIKQQGQILAARQPLPLTLACLAYNLASTQRFTRPEIILGRDPACDFPINDQTVSSRHARVSFRQNQWWLEDMASTNGTHLNGEAVTAPVVITHGDELRLGQVGVKVTIG
jgi:hypothetical protein